MSKKKPGSEETAIVNWDEMLATEAQAAAAQEKSTAIGNKIKITDGDIELPDGSSVPGDTMAVIILDSMLEHVYYDTKYDPDNPAPPRCFALGRDEETLKPHSVTTESGNQQSDACKGCPNNEWASADQGKGKACRSVRRLAVVVAGTIADEGEGKFAAFTPSELAQEQVMTLNVPVTSVKAFAGYVMRISGSLKRPPYGVITKVWTEKDKKTKYKIHFEALGKVERSHSQAVIAHKSVAQTLLDQPYPAPEETTSKKKGKAKPKAGARGPSSPKF